MTTVEWVRTGELVLIAIVACCYLYAFWSTLSGLIVGRAHSRLEARYATGRLFRHVAILSAFAGAAHGLVSNFDAHITARSVCWMILAWAAFIAFWVLDRNRWEAE